MMAMERRHFILLLAAAMPLAITLAHAAPASADDDGGDDSGGDGGDDGSDDSGDGSNSGSEDNESNNGNNESNDSSAGESEAGEDDHVKARDAVREGRILPLREILRRVDAMEAGRVISVDLSLEGKSPFYTLKVENDNGSVRTLRLNAVTGRKLSLFGW
ncbi:hypothetical protein NBH20_09395 [Rhizobium sp. S153]|uniref:PepSY domain-containing protein n=1 Tax=Ciceribacter sichuanensis TaxID=2949647 RepID=A0ABT0V661_9HYPH|nr:hypothetical protein [Ciceribacter sp. S153]MCM2401370.1 hypothetical protein [Ciceribacter sp. S153]